jgi:hypothetical protein
LNKISGTGLHEASSQAKSFNKNAEIKFLLKKKTAASTQRINHFDQIQNKLNL